MINNYSYTNNGFLDGTETIKKIEDFEHLFFLEVYRDYKTFYVEYQDYSGKVREEYYTYKNREEAVKKYDELLERKTSEVFECNKKLIELIERRQTL